MTNLQTLVEAIASETEIDASTVRNVSLALLNKFASLIEDQEDFSSPVVTFKSKSITPEGDDGQPGGPKKFARMNLRDN